MKPTIKRRLFQLCQKRDHAECRGILNSILFPEACTCYCHKAQRIAEAKQRANAQSIADGGFVIHPDEY